MSNDEPGQRCPPDDEIGHSSFGLRHCRALALPLFVLGVGADHAHDAFASDDLAVFTDAFD